MLTGDITFESVIVPLSVALGLSLMVERVLEVAKNFFESFIRYAPPPSIPSLPEVEAKMQVALEVQASQQRRSATESDAAQLVSALAAAKSPDEQANLRAQLAALQSQGEWSEQVAPLILTVEAATPPDKAQVLRSFVLQLLGLAVGIVLARVFELQLFHRFLGLDPAHQASLTRAGDYLLTGLLIGGGSAPIHFLIRFISERRVPAAAPLDAQEVVQPPPVAAAGAPSAVLAAPTGWTEILYDGGVDRDLLERIHRRSADPDMIVFHHTAMSSHSSFEDVVRTIKEHTDGKGRHWVTGYHCVVLVDGSVHPFCRWDRYGNHAAGYNARSLGIAFNGNFEPDPKVPYSNANGRFGALKPSAAQLQAAARVVALWTLLYNITLDFANTIVPHRKISAKTCPGSAFPYAEFEMLVTELVTLWKATPAVMREIEIYKRRPYLYVQPGVVRG